jgi:hypothetical protein
MRFEGQSEKRVKKAILREWIFRWIFKLDIHFSKSGYSKLLPSPPLWGCSNNPKKGGYV